MLPRTYTVAVIVLVSIINNEAARILAVFPTPSISHQVVFRPLTQELAKRGHEVIVITTDPAFPKGDTPANLREIDVHDASYLEWQNGLLVLNITTTGSPSERITQFPLFFDLFTKVVDVVLQNKEVQEILNDPNQKFDLLFLEACTKAALVFSHIFKVPVISISSFGRMFGSYEIVGAPTHPLLYPLLQRQKLNNLTLWDKFSELYNHYTILKFYFDNEVKENEMIRKHFGPKTPSVTELTNNVHMLFLNMHPIYEGNVPVPPSVIHMWGIYQKPKKELPKEFETYLDASKRGVIYMSFGTNVNPSLLPPERIQIFVKVFSQLPYDVLWKWNTDEISGTSENVRVGKWFPQSDIIRHRKVKLFITQGGLQSTDEAIEAGVPLIGMPMQGDQWFNVERYITHKIGIRIDLEALTEDGLKKAIKNIIEDESYRRNIIKLRTQLNDNPQPPLERAVWWTEYVLRHGGAKHLRSPAANMSWSEYLELELVLILLSGSAVIFSFGMIVVYSIGKYCQKFLIRSYKIKSE